MSRIGNKIITLPEGVKLDINGSTVTVSGSKGTLTRTFSNLITINVDGSSEFLNVKENDYDSLQ